MIEDGGITLKEYEERVEKCLSEMEEKKIDVLLVYGDSVRPENLIYLTNYRPIGNDLPGFGSFPEYPAVFLLMRSGEATIIIDRDWYVDWCKEESWVENVVASRQGEVLDLSYDVLRKRKLLNGRIGIDVSYLPTSFYLQFRKMFSEAKVDENFNIIAKLRETKSKEEIELISKGLEILGKAHEVAFAMAKEGIREIDIAQAIRQTELDEGAEYPTALFVYAGRRSTIPLANPMASSYRLKRGDMVQVSIFCTYKKYSAGMDRDWVVGEPSERQRKLADIELKGLEKAISLVKPGVKANGFNKPVYTDFVEPLLKEAGFTDYHVGGYVGHGTGLGVVETPILWPLDPTVLRPGMVIDVEPGIYPKDPKIGGMRTADFVVVTETGCEVLTKHPSRRMGTWG
jgi:Xaa-Pro aminopeptidase